MIPKEIHYCRLGNNSMPKLSEKCIESWKKILPDYKIHLWNEKNFNIDICKYVRQAYDAKKYAFVWDYLRLYVMYEYGGVTLDTDVKVLKNIDTFLSHRGFSGFEIKDIIPTGIIGFEKGHPFLKYLLDYYNNISFLDEQGNPKMIANTILISDIAKKYHGFKGGKDEHIVLSDDFHIYPEEFFCPKDNYGRIIKTGNSYTIHYFNGSWLTNRQKLSKLIFKYPIKICKALNIYEPVSKIWRKYILKCK